MYHGVNATNSPKDYPKYSPGFVVVSLLLELLSPPKKKKLFAKSGAPARFIQNARETAVFTEHASGTGNETTGPSGGSEKNKTSAE